MLLADVDRDHTDRDRMDHDHVDRDRADRDCRRGATAHRTRPVTALKPQPGSAGADAQHTHVENRNIESMEWF